VVVPVTVKLPLTVVVPYNVKLLNELIVTGTEGLPLFNVNVKVFGDHVAPVT